ncbi:Dyp-type peroxidase family [Segniliparus rotundus DSM 44985]|uniref:Deferrochelatase n=1 Tax=Segniliparus rotundus (strain ATCC BAA-972 / CDC 1076 / CIP 108378 / DSM 44985 / JCM 13578) TaxID=640132 RepID=D6ZC24_SEGRD|nr:iron uptake transporter deferrochelatase/peroxidase subunit [Segniliparus rotundus]ADG97001.1 Dyp-type peroxidase family [Segniliparus rotundus DSM 44985]
MNNSLEPRYSRRQLLAVGGASAVVAAGAGAAAGRAHIPERAAAGSDRDGVVPFRAAHQAGIVTAQQDQLHFAALDVMTESREELVALIKQWTVMAERMTKGQEATPGGAMGGNPLAPPQDTGEAFDLAPAQLTITVGFGPGIFEKDGKDRFGLAKHRPEPLTPLPGFPGDALEPARCGGDVVIQACANDPQVAVHAVRNLVRTGFGVVSVRWSQLGFGRTSSTSTRQVTPRNLFGFKDGTNNIKAEETNELDKHIWVAKDDGPDWLVGGTYLVARRIRMNIERWDRDFLKDQEQTIGRTKESGAPLSGGGEFEPLDLDAKLGVEPAIPWNAHVRLASHQNLGGIRILRRGYNFTDGSDGVGHLDAGLFFLAFCRDPQKQFVPMQQTLAKSDALNEYIKHTGSALFVCPPGLGDGEYWGQKLFEG